MFGEDGYAEPEGFGGCGEGVGRFLRNRGLMKRDDN
jgi:hypothetical protein